MNYVVLIDGGGYSQATSRFVGSDDEECRRLHDLNTKEAELRLMEINSIMVRLTQALLMVEPRGRC